MATSKNRQLAAILFADIVGYTALMQKDEQNAVILFRHFHHQLEEKVFAHNGRIVNFYGDGALCTFQIHSDYLIEDFKLPGGIPGNNVNCILEGPYGFLWFGSHAGLHRYDGYEFTTFKKETSDTLEETTSLTFPYVENLYWDSKNILWVGTYGGGLYRFDPQTEIFKHYKAN